MRPNVDSTARHPATRNSTSRVSSARDSKEGYVSLSDRGELTVTIPAVVVRVLTALALLASAVLLPAGIVALISVLATPPLGIFGLALLSAVAFVGPLASIAFAATLLG